MLELKSCNNIVVLVKKSDSTYTIKKSLKGKFFS